MTQLQTKEEILTSALPYIQRYEGKTFVIKYGGAAMTDATLKEAFAKEEGRMKLVDQKFEEAMKRKDELEMPIKPIDLE